MPQFRKLEYAPLATEDEANQPRFSGQPSWRRWTTKSFYLMSVELLTLFALVITNLILLYQLHKQQNRPVGSIYLPEQKKVLLPNMRYWNNPTPEIDAAWESTLGPNRGLYTGLVVLDPTKETIEPDLPGIPFNETAQIYGMSMFHQLHCLNVLRKIYWAAVDKKLDERSNELDGDFDFVMLHGNHCFDYLRQSIQCAADTTIEPAVPSVRINLFKREEHNHGPDLVVDGWNVEHQNCKNWDSAMTFMEDHAVPEGFEFELDRGVKAETI